MELLDLMFHRRSVRQYIPGEIPDADLTKILQAGLLSASTGENFHMYTPPATNTAKTPHLMILLNRLRIMPQSNQTQYSTSSLT